MGGTDGDKDEGQGSHRWAVWLDRADSTAQVLRGEGDIDRVEAHARHIVLAGCETLHMLAVTPERGGFSRVQVHFPQGQDRDEVDAVALEMTRAFGRGNVDGFETADEGCYEHPNGSWTAWYVVRSRSG